MQQTNNIRLQQALFYLETLNWSIIPVGKNKQPLVDWKEYQIRRPGKEEIIPWFEKYPDANIGIITGKISNLVVVDIDPRNGGSSKDFNRIITVKARTGGDGEHYYFLSDEEIKNTISVKPGIDIKGEGGFVIAPPSMHASGKSYEWVMSPQAGTQIAPLPSFVKEWIKNGKQNNNSSWNPEILKGCKKGTRNISAASITGKLLAYFPEKEWETTCYPLLQSWNKANNQNPLSEQEIRTVFNSIANRQKRGIFYKDSIPPEEILEIPLAEMNFETEIISWEDFTFIGNKEQKPWLIQDILRPGWLAVLGGHGKHGKSTLAFHLLNLFRNGGSFINSCSHVPVLYLNCEMAAEDTRQLIESLPRNTEKPETALIINLPQLPVNLKWLGTILQKQPKNGVCVIDSFRGAFLLSGDTENQAGTVGGILRRLQFIARKTNWAIILIHHFRKSGTGEALDLAGSGEWLSAPDVIFTWNCPNFKEPGTLTAIGRIPPCEPLAIKLSREKIEFLGTVDEQTAQAERQKILNILGEEWKTSSKIAKNIELPEGTTRRRLAELYNANQIERQGEGKKGNPHQWKKLTNTSTNKDLNLRGTN